MRISLLLQREPFPAILERTLTRFWSEKYGNPFAVTWQAQTPVTDAQHWLVNIYTNSIFVPNAQSQVFEPIRREFARSTTWWKRPFQLTYVHLASFQGTSQWLSHAALSVSPDVPDATTKLIVAGNHKIRLLDLQRRNAYAICKDGFSTDFLSRETSARRWAQEVGISVPALFEEADDHTWFREEYLLGTPINRLADSRTVFQAIATISAGMRRLYAKTCREVCAAEYATQLRDRIDLLLNTNHLLAVSDKQVLLQATVAVVERVASLRPDRFPLFTALTHGDLQPGNILVASDGPWLIDWEYAGERLVGYDALVLGLNTRGPAGVAQRLQAFVRDGSEHFLYDLCLEEQLVGWHSQENRTVAANLFLLEELLLYLEEHANLLFSQIGGSLRQISLELAAWLIQPTAA